MKKIVLCVLTALMLFQSVVYAGDLSDWAKDDYAAASCAGLVSYDVVIKNVSENITRGEFCSLAVNLYNALSGEPLPTPDVFPFEDSISYPVAQAYSLGIVTGVSDTEFAPDELITREQIATVISAVMSKCGIDIALNKNDKKLTAKFDDRADIHEWAINSAVVLLKYDILSGVDENTLAPTGSATREQAIALVNRTYSKFAGNDADKQVLPTITAPKNGDAVSGDVVFKWDKNSDAKKYRLIVKDSSGNAKIVYTTAKNTATIPVSKLESGKKYTVVLQSETEKMKTFSLPVDFAVKAKGTEQAAPQPTSGRGKAAESDKELRVFESGFYFSDKAEAMKYMTDITVDVWKINADGEKYASTLTLTVNRNLADDVKSIFREIFEDSEKFPIKSAGGFQWRNSASGRISQHSYGTCIDINPNENYYVSTSGKALSGSYWKPNDDPYSITEDGIVVRTFAKYGFLWGGNAWGEHSSKDYMHFTYLGN